MKRIFDIFCSSIGIIILSPIFLIAILLIYLEDKKNPFYISARIGKRGRLFKMIKFRSMRIGSDLEQIDSTSINDPRITKIGHLIRKYKIDELAQLINVLNGSMSLVGPRPNVKRETDLYSKEEIEILNVKPGITDFASIVFSDEATILKGKEDPDIAYNQLIRPWKSRLAIIYSKQNNLFIDIALIFITIIGLFSRDKSLLLLVKLLKKLKVKKEILNVAKRNSTLIATPPPGFKDIVQSRDIF